MRLFSLLCESVMPCDIVLVMMAQNRALNALRSPAFYIVLLTLAGLALRVYRIGDRGFWFDEIVFAYPARLPTLGALLKHIQEWIDHTPLSFFLVWFMRGFGGSEAVVRLPFAVAGALGIPAIYLLGKALANVRTGMLAALIYAILPFAVFISQDAHPYTPIMLLSTLQALFAYRAGSAGSWRDWVGFGLLMTLNLYNDYLAMGVSAVTVLFLALLLLSKYIAALRAGTPQDKGTKSTREVGVQLIKLVLTVAVVFVVYLPWLGPTLTFLKMPVRTFYSVRSGGATFDDVVTLLNDLGINVLLVGFVVVGLGVAVVTLWREKSPASLLLLIWLGGPLAGLWLLAGDRLFLLQARYFSFLIPAAIILAAIGADRLAGYIKSLHKRFYAQRDGQKDLPPYVSNVAFAALAMLMLAFTIPAMIGSYSWTKPVPQSFKEATQKIIAESPPGSIALSVGMWAERPAPPFTIQGVEHYLWLYKSPIPYIDASLVDEHMVAQMANEKAVVWGVYAIPSALSPESLQSANELGLDVTALTNVALLRTRQAGEPMGQQIDTLLQWGMKLQPGLMATRSLLNSAYKVATLGENVLPPIAAPGIEDPEAGANQQDKWRVPPNASLEEGRGAFVLNTAAPDGQTNVTLSTNRLVPGKKYVVSFEYSNAQLRGEQRVYLSTYTKDGVLIETFPYGVGFLCPNGPASGSSFLFTMPPKAESALLWLRIMGEGRAEFSKVEIRPIR